MMGAPEPLDLGWRAFAASLQRDILPLYLKHEQTFDPVGIHGRMHICRSLIFAEAVARFYRGECGAEVDLQAVRLAVAFHDSGRQGNGTDYWEADSAGLCREYLERTLPAEPRPGYFDFVSKLILKDGEWSLEHRIVYDADVLEIMRPYCAHGGLAGFKRERLMFGRADDPYAARTALVRENLVQGAWRWINLTEKLRGDFEKAEGYMTAMLEVFSHSFFCRPQSAEAGSGLVRSICSHPEQR